MLCANKHLFIVTWLRCLQRPHTFGRNRKTRDRFLSYLVVSGAMFTNVVNDCTGFASSLICYRLLGIGRNIEKRGIALDLEFLGNCHRSRIHSCHNYSFIISELFGHLIILGLQTLAMTTPKTLSSIMFIDHTT